MNMNPSGHHPRRSAALVNKDIAALTALLHPQFLYVNSSGQVLDRALL